MRTTAGLTQALVVFVLGLVIAGAGPAGADWYVTGVTYTYGGSAYANYEVMDGTIPIGHILREPADQGIYYYAEAIAYGTANTRTNTIDTDTQAQHAGHRVLGFGNWYAQLNLGGGGPPQRPSTWPQRSNLSATFSFHFETADSPPNYRGTTHGFMGTIGHNPPTMGWGDDQVWDMSDPDPYNRTASHQLVEPNFVSRTTTSSYLAGWVYARAIARVTGFGGQALASTEATGQGIVEHNP
jgi:hypothetical protein